MRGGYRGNAGRPSWHAKTSQALRLDVRMFARKDWLQRGASSTLQWTSGASIGYRLNDNASAIVLSYRYTFSDGRRDIEQHVCIERTPCRFGGTRPWFLCPRCWRRVAIIYLHGWPKCRSCSRLVYPSQSDDVTSRSWRRTGKIERRLAGDSEKWNHRRPKGMRRSTFDRLREAYGREEEIRDDLLGAFMVRNGWLLK